MRLAQLISVHAVCLFLCFINKLRVLHKRCWGPYFSTALEHTGVQIFHRCSLYFKFQGVHIFQLLHEILVPEVHFRGGGLFLSWRTSLGVVWQSCALPLNEQSNDKLWWQESETPRLWWVPSWRLLNFILCDCYVLNLKQNRQFQHGQIHLPIWVNQAG